MVRCMTGLGRSTIYRMEADGQFPPRIKLGMRAVGWLERDVRCVPFRCDRTVIPAEPRNQNAAGHRQRYTRACRQQGAISVLASLLHCSKADQSVDASDDDGRQTFVSGCAENRNGRSVPRPLRSPALSRNRLCRLRRFAGDRAYPEIKRRSN